MPKNKTEEIAEYLNKHQDKFLKNSYATEFYALLCALLFDKTEKEVWKVRAIKGIRKSLIIYRNRKKIDGVYRWEFKNYALLMIYKLMRDYISEDLRLNLRYVICSWKNLNSFETNWFAMRSVNYMERFRLFGRKLDYLRAKINMKVVLKRQKNTGFFFDKEEDGYSEQYHAYTLALVYQYYKLTGATKIKKAFMEGVECINSFNNIIRYNSFASGRGEKQIFGYACVIYVLKKAYEITLDKIYLKKANKVFKYVSKQVNKKNDYPIILKGGELFEYNDKFDYLPFFAYYLLK